MAYRRSRFHMRPMFGATAAPADQANLTSSANDVLVTLGEVQTHLSHLIASGLSPDVVLQAQQQIDSINSQVQAITQAITSTTTDNVAAIQATLANFRTTASALRDQLYTYDDKLATSTLGKTLLWGGLGIAAATTIVWFVVRAANKRRR